MSEDKKSKKIKFLYACTKVPSKSFIIMLKQDATVQDVLTIICNKQKDNDYVALYYEGSLIDGEEEIYDYWESDPEYIFWATDGDPPSPEFMKSVMESKAGVSSISKIPSAEVKRSDSTDSPAAKTSDKSKDSTGTPAAVPPIGKVVAPPIGKAVAPPIGKNVAPPIGKAVAPPIGKAVAPPVGKADSSAGKPKADSPAGKPKPDAAPSGRGAKLLQPAGGLTPGAPTTNQLKDQFTPGAMQNVNIQASVIGNNPHNAGIYTKDFVRKDVVDNFQFFFTGSTKDHLMEGINVELDTKMNPNQARTRLQEALQKAKVNMNNKQLIVYLPGGIPFVGGTLGDIYLKEDMKVKRYIYGVITRHIAENVLNLSFHELCNVSDTEHKLLISPLVDSSSRGLSDMACLMGYLNHDGIKGDLLLKTCAATVHFPPLVTSMNRIIERNQVVGRDVITVCSTLYTYFRCYLPETVADNKVFEYGLRMCNLISHIGEIPEKIPMMQIEVKPDKPDTKFLSDLKLGPIVYFWRADVGEDFNYVELDIQGPEAIENAYNLIASFTPIAPLSMRVATGCSIVRGKEHEYLYLMQSNAKDAKSQNKVDIIDPLTGQTESEDVEVFAQKQGNTKTDTAANLIDPDRVKQIIMVNFDESKSMIGDLAGYVIPPKSDKDHRVTIAIQYLTAFANRTYGYRIPCIQGLVSFNNSINVRCPLSPLVPDFEDKGLKKIRPDSITKLWDSLIRSCDEIVKFRKDSKGKDMYKNATSRILVISDGEDVNSNAKVEDVVKELLKNKIIVDSVIISSEDDCKMLCAVCHATGGLSFRPENVKEGLSLFEQSAFLNYEERKNRSDPLITGERNTIPSRLKPEQITEDFMNRAKDCAKFDTEIQNKELIQAAANVRLATPRHVCAKNQSTVIPNPRQRRILRELHAAAEINDSESTENKKYDPDMKVYTFQSNLDRWRVFLKGPEGTPYANKWWYLYVTFPELYPVQAPIFRFVTVPYHLNVSSEGRICLNIIEKGYISSKHVVEIIQEIKELFLLPSEDTPVQIETYDLFKNNRDKYEKLAKESAEKNAKDDYHEYIGSSLVVDEVPDDFKIQFTDNIPPYMMSQISGKPIQNKVMASSGVYYDRDELRQLVASNKNPICVITGKVLTERPEDLIDPEDDAI